jgi:lipoate-protein ligase A
VDEPRLAGSVLDSYRRLAEALLAALLHLNLNPQVKEKPAHPGKIPAQGPVCFEVPSDYEILVEGKKLVGSAQARRKGGMLQHGSLPLYGDLGRITQVLHFRDEVSRQLAAERLAERAATVESILGYLVSWEKAAQACATAFKEKLELELLPGGLNPSEQSRARELVDEKYNHPSWTERI